MRLAKEIALAAAFAVGTTAAVSAAPLVPSLASEQVTNIVQVAGGCGRGWHPNRWGRCAPNRYYGYGYGYGYGYYRPYGYGRYYYR